MAIPSAWRAKPDRPPSVRVDRPRGWNIMHFNSWTAPPAEGSRLSTAEFQHAHTPLPLTHAPIKAPSEG